MFIKLKVKVYAYFDEAFISPLKPQIKFLLNLLILIANKRNCYNFKMLNYWSSDAQQVNLINIYFWKFFFSRKYFIYLDTLQIKESTNN